MIYYISDLHLGDERVFNLCNRPFSSTEEMESKMIERWNSKVTDNDDVYVLGDIANGTHELVHRFVSRVKGKKHLIVGNHDEDYLESYLSRGCFESVDRILFIDDNGRRVCLCHYPIMDWQYGDTKIHHIYGHIHNKNKENSGDLYGKIKDFYRFLPAYNTSVDVINFEPVTLDELIKIKEDQKR